VNGEGKIRIKILTVVVVAIGLAIAAGHWGWPAYRHFKEKRGVAQARAFFAKGDYRNTWLSVRQALLVNSNNVQACRIMAELEDAVHSPATLDWCRWRAALSPTTDNKLLLASVGLRYQGPPRSRARCSTICPCPPPTR
jgi:hypothetical protein